MNDENNLNLALDKNGYVHFLLFRILVSKCLSGECLVESNHKITTEKEKT
jgi:hypothetical protein